MPGMTQVRVITCLNWHTSDIECNGILSCDCGTDNRDSPKKVTETISIYKSYIKTIDTILNLNMTMASMLP